jgi:hypothetical protein
MDQSPSWEANSNPASQVVSSLQIYQPKLLFLIGKERNKGAEM